MKNRFCFWVGSLALIIALGTTSPATTLVFVKTISGIRQICTIKADGTSFTVLTDFSSNPTTLGQPTYSPDGGKIAFWLDQGSGLNIWIMNHDGSNLAQVTYNNEYAPSDRPEFSSNADTLYYRRTVGAGAASIWKVRTNGEGDGLYYDFPGNEYMIEFVGNNYLLFYVHGGGLYRTASLSDFTSSLLIAGGQQPAVSPDLTKLAYQAYGGGHDGRLMLSNIDGSSPTLLSDEGSIWIYHPSFTTDGQYVVYSTSDSVKIVKTDGTGLRTITSGMQACVRPNESGSITVTSPNGGEAWATGSTHNITWTCAFVDSVKIELSTDNALTWSTIIPSTPAASGSYSWTLPTLPANQCRVRISDVGYPSVADTSDNSFTITGLVAYYPFNGNANDESGNGNDGAEFGPSLTTDRFGNLNRAYYFDGINDSIRVLNSTSLNPSYIALCGWVYYQGAAYNAHPFNKGTQFDLFIETSLGHILGSHVNGVDLRSNSTVSLNQWTFICLTKDADTVRLYKNGILVKSLPSTGVITPTYSNFTIGSNSGYPSTSLLGKIDDVRLYNHALSDFEIDSLYHEGNWFPCQTIFLSNNGRLDSLEYGVAPGATDGIDSLYGEVEQPPVPPVGVFDVRLQITGTQGAKRDIRDTLGGARVMAIYRAIMQGGSGGSVFTLSWKREMLPVGTFTLRYGADSLNMKQHDSLTISADMSPVQIVYDRRSTLFSSVQNGWNIVSIPMTVPDLRKTVVLPGASSNAFAFTPLGYATRDTLDYGVGYWIKFPSARTLSIIGEPILQDTIDVIQGWNLIGSISNAGDTGSVGQIPNGIVASQYFGYSGAGYSPSPTIDPMHGYWVKVNQNGKLVLAGSPYVLGKFLSNPVNSVSKFASLYVADQLGCSQEMLFTSQAVPNPDYFELPPTPPAGLFDARFATNRMLEAVKEGESRTVPIQISYAQYPLTISWDMKDQLVTSSLIVRNREVLMNGTGSITITDAEASIALKLGGQSTLPKEFALAQNYPNPFNPSTTIKYGLPEDSRVSLKLFNVLGQEVATLVNEEQKAGYRSIEWNANNLASGVYFYRLQAGDFVASKKLLLLK